MLFTLWNSDLPNSMNYFIFLIITIIAHGDLDHSCIGVILATYFSKETGPCEKELGIL